MMLTLVLMVLMLIGVDTDVVDHCLLYLPFSVWSNGSLLYRNLVIQHSYTIVFCFL